MNPEISIIIPIFNSESYLRRCFDSICNQSYANFEVILVDDGSTDNSVLICENICHTDARFHLICQKHLGPSAARNFALSVAQGSYIAFIDSDDYIGKKYLEHMVMSKTDEGVITNYCQVINDVVYLSDVAMPSRMLSTEEIIDGIFNPKGFKGYLWNKLFSNNIIRDNKILFNVNISVWEDMLFCFMYYLHCSNVYFSNVADYYYIQHVSSLSHNKSISNAESMFEAIRIIKDLSDNYCINNERINNVYCKTLIERLAHGDSRVSPSLVVSSVESINPVLNLKERVFVCFIRIFQSIFPSLSGKDDFL